MLMNKKVLFALSVFLFSASVAHAQVSDAARIQNEQQRLINEEFRRQEIYRATRKRPAAQETPTASEEKADELSPTSCINIKKIEFEGNAEVCTKCIDATVAKYINQCLSLPQIDAMMLDITNLYINEGFVTSRAYMSMPQTKLKEGVLEIKIIEGKISKIEGVKKSEKFTAFPRLIGKTLNIRDIEQGLDQMNRLSSNKATMSINPDEKQNNFSKILIDNTPQGRSKLTLFSDNAGSKSTGETRFGMRSLFENIFGINEQVNMTYTLSPSQSRHHRNANSFALGVSIPYGYWTLTNNFSWSSYRTSFNLINGDRFYSYGNSTTNDISLERLLSRGQKHKISLGGGLLYKTNSNYSKVLDYKTRNDVSSRDLTIVHLDAPMTFYSDYGMFYVKPSYYQGVRMFDSMRDKDYNYSQKAQYQAWKLYSYYNNYFGKINYTTTVEGMYSNDELFGSEAMYLGGEYTVRGFKEDSVQGDTAWTLRQDAKINLAHAFNSENKVLKGITPGLFLDYGYAKSNHPNLKSETLAGAGAGVELNYGYFEGRISYAEPIHKPKHFEENHAWYIYTGIGIRF